MVQIGQEKMMNIIKFARKLQATAKMMRADLGILGAKLIAINE